MVVVLIVLSTAGCNFCSVLLYFPKQPLSTTGNAYLEPRREYTTCPESQSLRYSLESEWFYEFMAPIRGTCRSLNGTFSIGVKPNQPRLQICRLLSVTACFLMMCLPYRMSSKQHHAVGCKRLTLFLVYFLLNSYPDFNFEVEQYTAWQKHVATCW